MPSNLVILPDNQSLSEKYRNKNHVAKIGSDGKAIPLCFCLSCNGYTGEIRVQVDGETSLVLVPHQSQDHARLSKKPGSKVSKGSATRKFLQRVADFNKRRQRAADNIDRLLNDNYFDALRA